LEEEEEKEVILPMPKKLLDVEEDGGDEEDDEEDLEMEQQNIFKPDQKSGKSKVIDIEFELVLPSEAYYHSVRALLN
jgi:hypothetical protein